MYKIIGVDGKEYGPANLDQLTEWINGGRVNGQTRVQAEGSGDWKLAAEVPAIAAFLPPPLPPPGASGSPFPPAIGPLPGAGPKHNGLAIASFVLGLASLIVCLFALAGIPAIICGHIARRQIRNSPVPQRGAGLALAS